MNDVNFSLPLEELLGVTALKMNQTPQNPRWHGEGDVLTHTKLVCQAAAQLPVNGRFRQILSLAAALHDIGKVATTRMEDGQWTSPSHSRVGAEMARQLLWQEHGLCGTPEKQRLRETVCSLIRFHSVPPHALTDSDGERTLRRIAANGGLTPDFTIELLCLLAEADVQGRVCDDGPELLEQIQFCRELAREAGCLTEPFPFPSDYTRFAYLSGRNVPPDQPLYNDSWGEVILMSGLPGTGKDTWITAHHPDLPVISLDEIRKEFGISPGDNQGAVADVAKERAKEFLRKKQPFIWNATNFSPMVRKKQIDLFTAYHASVRLVYLETTWEEQLRRNRSRPDAVPESVLCKMAENIIPPAAHEAHRVEWYCI